jgi:hypothetical protein
MRFYVYLAPSGAVVVFCFFFEPGLSPCWPQIHNPPASASCMHIHTQLLCLFFAVTMVSEVKTFSILLSLFPLLFGGLIEMPSVEFETFSSDIIHNDFLLLHRSHTDIVGGEGN